MGFNLDPATHPEKSLPKKFKARISGIIGCVSRPRDKVTGEETGKDTPQIVVKYALLDNPDIPEMVGFYSMGSSKVFTFDQRTQLTLGKNNTVIEGGYVIEGPDMDKRCRAHKWLSSASANGFRVSGNDLRIFLDTIWDVEDKEVEQQRDATYQEKDILLLTKFYGSMTAGGQTVPVQTATPAPVTSSVPDALEAQLIAVAIGKKFPAEFIGVAYGVALNSGNKDVTSKVLDGRWVEEMIKQGKLLKDANGVLQKGEKFPA
jgi:hypothetical protein